MQFYPIYLNTVGKMILVSGAGECALAKIRLLIRTEARIRVFGAPATESIRELARAEKIELVSRPLSAADLDGALMLYAANADDGLDRTAAALGRAAGVPTLIVDNLDESDFITPAIVDRDPVTVAIGTEGAAPVLARKIKADVDALLPQSVGSLARIGKAFRPMVRTLPFGRPRRDFWARYYFDLGPKALEQGEWAVVHLLRGLIDDASHETPEPGHVDFVGAGPGDPELMTLKARKLLHEADVVLHDSLVTVPILDLARREALLVEVGKTGFGPSWRQADINALLVKHGATSRVVRLKSGDGAVFGRLDEEISALEAAGIGYSVTPGITSAAAAAATMRRSLTQRGRNSELRVLSAQDTQGFAEHDWANLARPGAVAAVYMGKVAAEFLRGRLLMHGAAPETPVTVVANASRPDQRILATTLLGLPEAAREVDGPAVLMLGLAPRTADEPAAREAR